MKITALPTFLTGLLLLVSLHGAAQLTIDGTWYEQTGDTMFNMQWDPDSAVVAGETASWGAMKFMYR